MLHIATRVSALGVPKATAGIDSGTLDRAMSIPEPCSKRVSVPFYIEVGHAEAWLASRINFIFCPRYACAANS
ncbi:unnamed protein product, partial [Iphiclides podalirius]